MLCNTEVDKGITMSRTTTKGHCASTSGGPLPCWQSVPAISFSRWSSHWGSPGFLCRCPCRDRRCPVNHPRCAAISDLLPGDPADRAELTTSFGHSDRGGRYAHRLAEGGGKCAGAAIAVVASDAVDRLSGRQCLDGVVEAHTLPPCGEAHVELLLEQAGQCAGRRPR